MSKVMQFGALPPTTNVVDVDQQMYLAHVLDNNGRLVERARRGAVREAYWKAVDWGGKIEGFGEIKARLDETEKAELDAVQALREHRIRSRSKRGTSEEPYGRL